MNYKDFKACVANELSGPISQATVAADAVVSALVKALKTGNEVRLPGLGTFKPFTRAARTGRNPQTGESIEVGEKKDVKFKADAGLKSSL